MLELMEQLLQPLLGLAAVAYAALAVRIGRSDPQYANSAVSYLLLLFAGMLAGSALSYGAASADLYNVGRALSFISAGFVPVAFFCIYREYTSTLATKTVLTTRLIIPVITTAMAGFGASKDRVTAAGLRHVAVRREYCQCFLRHGSSGFPVFKRHFSSVVAWLCLHERAGTRARVQPAGLPDAV